MWIFNPLYSAASDNKIQIQSIGIFLLIGILIIMDLLNLLLN